MIEGGLFLSLLAIIAVIGVFTLFAWIIRYLWFAFVTIFKLLIVGFIMGAFFMAMINGNFKKEHTRNEPTKYSIPSDNQQS